MKAKKYWTDDEEKELAVLVEKGMSRDQIATSLGRTQYSIASRLSMMGLSIKNEDIVFEWTEEECKTLYSLAKKGHSIDYISKLLPQKTISSIAQKADSLGAKIKSGKIKSLPVDSLNIKMEKVCNPIPLEKLSPDQCRYGHYDQNGFCGKNVFKREMCKHHYDLCYTRDRKNENTW